VHVFRFDTSAIVTFRLLPPFQAIVCPKIAALRLSLQRLACMHNAQNIADHSSLDAVSNYKLGIAFKPYQPDHESCSCKHSRSMCVYVISLLPVCKSILGGLVW
jgi:hypothetical protein